MKRSMLAVALILAAGVARAQDAAPMDETVATSRTTGFVLSGAYEGGGETLVTAPGSSKKLRAGEGINLGVGAYHRFAGSPISLRGTIGFKFAGAEINGVKYALARVPLEFIGSYHFANDLRVGAGLVLHLGTRLKNAGSFPDVRFDDAGGGQIEFGYKLLLLTLTGMDYKDQFGNKYKAGSIGLRLVFEFGAPWLS